MEPIFIIIALALLVVSFCIGLSEGKNISDSKIVRRIPVEYEKYYTRVIPRKEAGVEDIHYSFSMPKYEILEDGSTEALNSLYGRYSDRAAVEIGRKLMKDGLIEVEKFEDPRTIEYRLLLKVNRPKKLN